MIVSDILYPKTCISKLTPAKIGLLLNGIAKLFSFYPAPIIITHTMILKPPPLGITSLFPVAFSRAPSTLCLFIDWILSPKSIPLHLGGLVALQKRSTSLFKKMYFSLTEEVLLSSKRSTSFWEQMCYGLGRAVYCQTITMCSIEDE